MKSLFPYALLFAGFLQATHAQDSLPEIQLLAQNKQIALQDSTRSQLHSQIIALVQSSNLDSPRDRHYDFSFTGVQQDYRDAVATGEYLLMILSPAQKIHTVAGDVVAAEIVIGLQRPGSKNSVFTIDDSGKITSHAKYSGEIYLELKKTVAQARS